MGVGWVEFGVQGYRLTVASLGPGQVDGACPRFGDPGRCRAESASARSPWNCGLSVSASPQPARVPSVMIPESWGGAGSGALSARRLAPRKTAAA